jgi:hypothetical protein
MGYEVTGVIGFLVLLLNIWAVLKIVGSGASTLSKVIWIAIVLILPIVGVIAWYVFGPKS